MQFTIAKEIFSGFACAVGAGRYFRRLFLLNNLVGTGIQRKTRLLLAGTPFGVTQGSMNTFKFFAVLWKEKGRVFLMLVCGLGFSMTVSASDDVTATEPEAWNFYGQVTHVTQWHGSFRSPYSGDNSLDGGSRHEATNDLTLYAGMRLWPGAELYANPEIDEGFGLNNTLGMAGFSSGEAYKVGAHHPYLRLPRFFLRQTIDLSGNKQSLESGANQLAGGRSENNLVFTLGKFAITDIFDTNIYAHDPRSDFLNWSIVDAGAFDYAADSWGYTKGLAAEWTQSWWTLRGGVFALSSQPNSERLDSGFRQYALVGEFEERHQWWGNDGKFKVLGFINRGNMASYTDAVRAGLTTGSVPDAGSVRRMQSRPGIAFNLEQALSSTVGMFARLSWNDGRKEAFDFTEINRSLSAGLSIGGAGWGRQEDKLGVAVAINGLSKEARQYFSAGGMGILIGDGQLNYGWEQILESYYSLPIAKDLRLTADYQYVVNPAYNRDRGPVSIYAMRVHWDF